MRPFRNKFLKIAFFTGLLAGLGTAADAQELMSPATQLGGKKVHAEVYYRHLAKQKLNLTVGGNSAVLVRGSTITSSSSADLESDGNGNGVLARVTFQPFEDGLQYYVVGGVSSYGLKVPSGTYANTYATDDPGVVVGGGLRYTLAPYTMVTPAVSLDLSATHSRYKLTKFSAGDGRLVSDTGYLLTVFELQGALTVSRKFTFDLGGQKAAFDPYCGVKTIRTRANMDDLSSGAHFSGTETGFAPFVGFHFRPFAHEGFVVEGSFINELSASAGLTLQF